MKKIYTLSLIFLLSSCVTAEEADKKVNDRCKEYGFKLGTDAYAECLQKEWEIYKKSSLRSY